MALCGRRVGKTHVGCLFLSLHMHRLLAPIAKRIAAGKRKPWEGLQYTGAAARSFTPHVRAWVIAPRDANLDEVRSGLLELYSGEWARFRHPSFPPTGLTDRGGRFWINRGGACGLIELLPTSSDARMSGKGLDVLWVDEAGFVPRERFDQVLPALFDKGGRLLVSGTPALGDAHWFSQLAASGMPDGHDWRPREVAPRDTRVTTIHADTRLHAFGKLTREQAAVEAEIKGEQWTKQQLSADWRLSSTMVYDEWNPAEHVCDFDANRLRLNDKQLPKPSLVFVVHDWSGGAAPSGTIVVFCWRDGGGITPEADKRPLAVVVADKQSVEPYVSGGGGQWAILRKFVRDFPVQFILVDPHSPSLTRELRRENIAKVIEASRVDKPGRIAKVKAALHSSSRAPSSLYVSARCAHLPKQLSTLRYAFNRRGELTDKVADSMDDHCSDALAFGVEYFRAGPSQAWLGGRRML